MRGSNSIAMAACSHKPLHLHPFSFRQSDASRCQFRLQPCHREYGHLPAQSARRRHAFHRSYFPLTPNGSQLQLDLVCNGKAVNVAAKLQISCSGAGEQNRNLIDRIWKRESRHSSGGKRLQHSGVHYGECNGSRTDTVWGFPFVSGMHVTKRLKPPCSYFQTSTSHTMDLHERGHWWMHRRASVATWFLATCCFQVIYGNCSPQTGGHFCNTEDNILVFRLPHVQWQPVLHGSR